MKDKLPEKLRGPLLLCLVTLAAFSLRIFSLGKQSVWLDEASTYHYAKHGLLKIIGLLAHPACETRTPPLYFLSTHFFLWFGDSEPVLRGSALLFGVAGVPAMYLVGRELRGKSTGLLAAFMTSVSIFHIYYSQEARAYSMFFFLSALSTAYFLRLLRGDSLKDWLVYGLLTVLGFYCHYFTFWVFSAQVFCYAAARLLEGKNRPWLERLKGLRNMVLTGAAVSLCFLPWLRVVLSRMSNTSAAEIPALLSKTYINQIRIVLAGRMTLSVVYLLFFVAGCLYLYRKMKRRELFYLVFVLAYSIVGINLYLHGRTFFTQRYFIFLIVPFLAVVACGMTWLLERFRARRGTMAAAAVVLVVIIIQAGPLGRLCRDGRAYHAGPKFRWDELVREMGEGGGKKVIVPLPYYKAQTVAYYLRDEEGRFRLGNIDMRKEGRFERYVCLIDYDSMVDWAGGEIKLGEESVIIMKTRRLDHYGDLVKRLAAQLAARGYRLCRGWERGAVELFEYRRDG